MHTSTFTFTHSYTQAIHFMKHHRWITFLSIAAMLWIIFALNIGSNDRTFFRFREHSQVSADRGLPLAHLDAPSYQHIYEQLEALKDETGAQRIYVVSYSAFESGNAGISHVFEVVSVGQAPRLAPLKGMSIEAWSDIKNAIYEHNGLNPFRYSTELYDEHAREIGAFGIEFVDNFPLIQERRMLEHIRQTLRTIEAALSRSVGYQNVQM